MADATPQWDPNGNLVGPASYPVSANNVAAAPSTTTGSGDSGTTVTTIQQMLNQLGYGPVAVSGTFDSDTVEAVSQFQNASNIPVTGSVDPNTMAAMQDALNQLNGSGVLAIGQGNPNPLATSSGAATGVTSLLPSSVANFFGANRPAWQNALIYGGAAVGGGLLLWWLFKGGKKKKRVGHSRGLGAGDMKCSRSPDGEAFEAGEVVDVS